MPNPRAQKPLTLDQAVADIKSFAQPAQALGDMMASALRGSVAATAGLPGDVRELIDLFGPEAVERVLGKRVMPTTEEMKAMMPKATATENPYESIGEFMALPKTGTALKAARYGAGRGAGALTRTAGQAISDAMIHQTGPLASGPLSALAPRAAMTNVVKPKGGNWMNQNFDYSFKRLKSPTVAGETPAQRIVRHEGLLSDYSLSPESKATVERHLNEERQRAAIDNWVDRNLTNYVKNQMATPEDPVRKLAEEGVTHFPVAEDPGYWARHGQKARDEVGGTQMAQSPLAKQWENRTDAMINRESAQEHQDMMHLSPGMYSEKDSWIKNVPPDTPLYSAHGRNFSALDLGFDHIVDVLKQDLASGRIRPEQLNKVSMEQAVRRTFEYDQDMAKKMREAAIKQQEGFPLHKEYPEGYKWIELARPKDLTELPEGYTAQPYKSQYSEGVKIINPKGEQVSAGDTLDEALKNMSEARLEEALKYEGDTMGHCVGGYCPDVLEGRSRIFSLRDKRGEPHVTIEVEPQSRIGFREGEGPKTAEERFDLQTEWLKGVESGKIGNDVTFAEWWRSQHGIPEPERPLQISQIKGKQNAAPKADYLPYVQDFVKSGNWADVGDLHNTGLIRRGNVFTPTEKQGLIDLGQDVPEYLTQEDIAKLRRARGDLPPEEGMAAGGAPRHPTEKEREDLRKLRESFVPAATEAERQKRIQQNLEKMGNKVSFSDNPDTMMMDVQDQHFGIGGKAEKLVKLARAPAKSKEEIRAVAERIAPQMTGEFVRGEKGTQSVAGKTQKQFAREKEIKHDIRPTDAERPLPETLDYEKLKGNVVMGIAGDPTITGQTVESVAGQPLRSAAPQHGGPLYGLGRDDSHFWASNLGAARNVQNRVREIGQQYDQPVLGQYVMMGPESINYAQHFADANLNAIDPTRMSKKQIEGFNKLIREGSEKSGPRPAFPGIEHPEEAYLHFAVDPELRKHFNALMQMPTVTERFGLPSGIDVRHAVTEPALRDLETGVTGYSVGQMRPDITDLKLSEHPTYSHDIPGHFLGQSKYPIPYQLMFPDTVEAIRANPKQAPHEFGSLKMIGPRQTIDQQMIDEIKQYEEMIKSLTGKKKGGEIHVKPKKKRKDDGSVQAVGSDEVVTAPPPMMGMADGGLVAEDLEIEERPL